MTKFNTQEFNDVLTYGQEYLVTFDLNVNIDTGEVLAYDPENHEGELNLPTNSETLEDAHTCINFAKMWFSFIKNAESGE